MGRMLRVNDFVGEEGELRMTRMTRMRVREPRIARMGTDGEGACYSVGSWFRSAAIAARRDWVWVHSSWTKMELDGASMRVSCAWELCHGLSFASSGRESRRAVPILEQANVSRATLQRALSYREYFRSTTR